MQKLFVIGSNEEEVRLKMNRLNELFFDFKCLSY